MRSRRAILSVVRVSQKARSGVLSYLFLINSHECHEGELSFSHGLIGSDILGRWSLRLLRRSLVMLSGLLSKKVCSLSHLMLLINSSFR